MSKELLLSLLFIALSILLTGHLSWFMPTPMQMTILMFVLVLYAVFAGLTFKEHARDEREEQHLYSSSRTAFLLGTLLLIIVITYQTLTHALDAWLVWILVAMVNTKMISLWFMRRKDEK